MLEPPQVAGRHGDVGVQVEALEVRVPLLDHRVVEFAWSLPPSMKVGWSGGKLLLKKVLARHVPPALTERPKAGFGLPIARRNLRAHGGSIHFESAVNEGSRVTMLLPSNGNTEGGK